MFYKFASGLKELHNEDLQKEPFVYGCCTLDEMNAHIDTYGFSITTLEEYDEPKRIIHKMDSYYGYDFGVFHTLKRQEDGFINQKIGMYITSHMVLVICDDEDLEKSLYDAVDKMNDKTCCLAHMVSSILNGLLADNLKMIEEIESALAQIEEEILNNHTERFNQRTRNIRDDLFYLAHYYEQLIDACDELLQDENSFFQDTQIHHLRIFADRVNRLHSNVCMLREYLVQIRESCQSQMDANLNHIMYIFTVVTTIFLPLTLIVGWYGMNFQHMPELAWKYGYLGVILVSILIVVVCIWFFRRKKLLK